MEKAKAYLLSKCRISEADVQDVVQEAALRAFKKLSYFSGKSSFETWFIAICKMEALVLFRKNKFREVELSKDDSARHRELPSCESDALDDFDIEGRARLVNQALDKLSEKHREIIQIAMSNSGSSREIADLLKIPVNSARTRLHYAKKRLKKLLGIHAHKSNIQLPHN